MENFDIFLRISIWLYLRAVLLWTCLLLPTRNAGHIWVYRLFIAWVAGARIGFQSRDPWQRSLYLASNRCYIKGFRSPRHTWSRQGSSNKHSLRCLQYVAWNSCVAPFLLLQVLQRTWITVWWWLSCCNLFPNQNWSDPAGVVAALLILRQWVAIYLSGAQVMTEIRLFFFWNKHQFLILAIHCFVNT